MTDKCPKCGAGRLPGASCMNSINWTCHSYQYLDGFRRFNESSDCLRRQLVRAQAEIDRLRKTEDGVTMILGIDYWTLQHGEAVPGQANMPTYGCGKWWSTREAALAAKEK